MQETSKFRLYIFFKNESLVPTSALVPPLPCGKTSLWQNILVAKQKWVAERGWVDCQQHDSP
jgi:hypothetical protein